MLKAEKLSVSFGAAKILEDISFSAEKGEFICLLGPNGAGKTTLLRTIAGLLPFDGVVEIRGRDVRVLPSGERAKTIAYLPQTSAVHWPLRARDVVAIGRLPHSSSLTALGVEDEAAIDNALRRADALQFGERPITELSGGERARILLARALAVESNILLADEPLSALDPAHQLASLKLLAELAAGGKLVISAIHDLALAARFASRVVVMSGGRIGADGVPSAVLTDDLLRQIFSIETLMFEHEGLRIPVTWQTVPEDRDK